MSMNILNLVDAPLQVFNIALLHVIELCNSLLQVP